MAAIHNLQETFISKGLVLLSQKKDGNVIDNQVTYRGKTTKLSETAAFYTGDANLRNRDNVDILRSFLSGFRCNRLALVQIPHHGSRYNAGSRFDNDFAASYYFFQDKSSARLQQNNVLFNSLNKSQNLIEIRDVDCEILVQSIHFS